MCEGSRPDAVDAMFLEGRVEELEEASALLQSRLDSMKKLLRAARDELIDYYLKRGEKL